MSGCAHNPCIHGMNMDRRKRMRGGECGSRVQRLWAEGGAWGALDLQRLQMSAKNEGSSGGI